MQHRLRHLESLVKGVMTGAPSGTNGSQPLQNTNIKTSISTSQSPEFIANVSETDDTTSSTSESLTNSSANDPIHDGSGVLNSTRDATFIGATHWAAILQDIEDVKEYFEELDEGPNEELLDTFNSIAFNYQHSATKQELVNALPSKPILDGLVTAFFNSNSPLLSLLHKAKFEKEYRNFCLDPMNTPTSYIGLIYAIMASASFAIFGAKVQHPDIRGSPIDMMHSYRGSCVQALILSKYVKPGPHTMETLFLHIEGEFMLSQDGQMVPYLMIGNVVRLALRLGLHRDPSKVGGNFTPFQGEMRRYVVFLILNTSLS
jgi:hypothetical protein